MTGLSGTTFLKLLLCVGSEGVNLKGVLGLGFPGLRVGFDGVPDGGLPLPLLVFGRGGIEAGVPWTIC